MDALYVLWKYEHRQAAHEAEERDTYWALCIVLEIVMLYVHTGIVLILIFKLFVFVFPLHLNVEKFFFLKS